MLYDFILYYIILYYIILYYIILYYIILYYIVLYFFFNVHTMSYKREQAMIYLSFLRMDKMYPLLR